MTIFSDDVLMLNAAEMEEWYERELIMRAETELRVRAAGGTGQAVPAPPVNAALIPWVGLVPAQFNILNGQNFNAVLVPQASQWALLSVTNTAGFAGPDGTLTATKMVATVIGGNHKIDIGGFGMGGSTEIFDIPFRVQVIANSAELGRIVVRAANGNPGNGDFADCCVDLVGGNVGFDNQTTNWTIQSTTVTQPVFGAAPGWKMVTLDFTIAGPNNASPTIDVHIFLDNGSGTAPRSISFTGDGKSGVLLWYAVLLPRAAWLFSGESFRDDFTSLNTIDLNDTRAPGFNWYVHNRWPNSAPAAGNTWTTGIPTPAANFSISTPSVLKAITVNGVVGSPNIGHVFASVAADPATGNPTVLGKTFQAPCIIEGSFAFDPTDVNVAGGFITGAKPSFTAISLGLLSGTFPQAAEVDMADIPDATSFLTYAVSSQDAGGTIWVSQHAGNIPASPTDFVQFATMFFAPNASTNNHGFAMCFWKRPASTATINSMMQVSCSSLKWTSSSVLASQQFNILIEGGIGTVNHGAGFVPFVCPVFYDWIRVIT